VSFHRRRIAPKTVNPRCALNDRNSRVPPRAVDVLGGDHGVFSFRPAAIRDAAVDSALALPRSVQHVGMHSEAPEAWNLEPVSLLPSFR
jgi:hypothetical protein